MSERTPNNTPIYRSLLGQSWFLQSWRDAYQTATTPEVTTYGALPTPVQRASNRLGIHFNEIVLPGPRMPLTTPYTRGASLAPALLASVTMGSAALKPIARLYVWQDEIERIKTQAVQNGWHVTVEEDAQFPYVDVQGEERAYLTRLSAKLQKNLRRAEKSLGQKGEVVFQPETHASPEKVAQIYLALKRTKDVSHKYADPIHKTFLTLLLGRAHQAGALRVHFLKCADQVIAIHIGFQVDSILYYYFPAYDKRYAEFSPGLILLAKIIQTSRHDPDTRIVDLGRGEAAYKARFATGYHQSFRVMLFRSRLIQHWYKMASIIDNYLYEK